MKLHYCLAEGCLISYEGECNWCGEKEEVTNEPIQTIREGILERTSTPEDGDDFQIPVAPI